MNFHVFLSFKKQNCGLAQNLQGGGGIFEKCSARGVYQKYPLPPLFPLPGLDDIWVNWFQASGLLAIDFRANVYEQIYRFRIKNQKYLNIYITPNDVNIILLGRTPT